ncbi:copper chaperone PCu(A)C [Kocuria sp. LUK]|uniref:copper chaperone PCu(A)C n=1 Tax=Kocuria sp. LUK TaxID=2897828 RepID=UPI001E57DCAC|nr:copper chaperone PCu(A)C [Kocuria sp. LUK]MCD1146084.1 copper chaperone PCu(A)C [Kocuria sp. LUK]
MRTTVHPTPIRTAAGSPSAPRRPAGRSVPRLLRGTAVLALGALALTGCGTPAAGPEATAAASAAAADGTAADGTASGPLTVERPWAKARTTGGMTGVFGTLVNDGDSPVVLTGASAEGVAGAVELHETVLDPETGATVMRRLQEPVTIAPGDSYALEPGADHIMLLDLRCGLHAGDELALRLQFEDGTEQVLTAAIRDYAGAREEYRPGEGPEQGAPASHGTTSPAASSPGDTADGTSGHGGSGEAGTMHGGSAEGTPAAGASAAHDGTTAAAELPACDA